MVTELSDLIEQWAKNNPKSVPDFSRLPVLRFPAETQSPSQDQTETQPQLDFSKWPRVDVSKLPRLDVSKLPQITASPDTTSRTTATGEDWPMQVRRTIRTYAAKYGVPYNVAQSIADIETGGRNYDPKVRGSAGEIGIMQLLPSTAKMVGVNPEDWQQNIEGGVKYLAYLHNELLKRGIRDDDWRLTAAAYNAGLGAVLKHQGVPPYSVTQNYVKKFTDFASRVGKAIGEAIRTAPQAIRQTPQAIRQTVQDTSMPVVGEMPSIQGLEQATEKAELGALHAAGTASRALMGGIGQAISHFPIAATGPITHPHIVTVGEALGSAVQTAKQVAQEPSVQRAVQQAGQAIANFPVIKPVTPGQKAITIKDVVRAIPKTPVVRPVTLGQYAPMSLGEAGAPQAPAPITIGQTVTVGDIAKHTADIVKGAEKELEKHPQLAQAVIDAWDTFNAAITIIPLAPTGIAVFKGAKAAISSVMAERAAAGVAPDAIATEAAVTAAAMGAVKESEKAASEEAVRAASKPTSPAPALGITPNPSAIFWMKEATNRFLEYVFGTPVLHEFRDDVAALPLQEDAVWAQFLLEMKRAPREAHAEKLFHAGENGSIQLSEAEQRAWANHVQPYKTESEEIRKQYKFEIITTSRFMPRIRVDALANLLGRFTDWLKVFARTTVSGSALKARRVYAEAEDIATGQKHVVSLLVGSRSGRFNRQVYFHAKGPDGVPTAKKYPGVIESISARYSRLLERPINRLKQLRREQRLAKKLAPRERVEAARQAFRDVAQSIEEVKDSLAQYVPKEQINKVLKDVDATVRSADRLGAGTAANVETFKRDMLNTLTRLQRTINTIKAITPNPLLSIRVARAEGRLLNLMRTIQEADTIPVELKDATRQVIQEIGADLGDAVRGLKGTTAETLANVKAVTRQVRKELKQADNLLRRATSVEDQIDAKALALENEINRLMQARQAEMEASPGGRILRVKMEDGEHIFRLRQALTADIENVTNTRYIKDPLLAELLHWARLKIYDIHMKFFRSLPQKYPELISTAQVRADWRSATDIPQLRGWFGEYVKDPRTGQEIFKPYYMHPYVHDTLKNMLTRRPSPTPMTTVFRVLRASIFWNPFIHIPNITQQYVLWQSGKMARELFSAHPQNFGRYTARAWQSALINRHIYGEYLQEALDAGLPLVQVRKDIPREITEIIKRTGPKELQDVLLPDLEGAVPRAQLPKAARLLAGAVRWWYDHVDTWTWAANDQLMLAAYIERRMLGDTPKEAVRNVTTMLPSYRLPASAWAKYFRPGELAGTFYYFVPYHANMIRSWWKLTDLILPRVPLSRRIEAAGQLLGIAVSAHMYAWLSEMIQQQIPPPQGPFATMHEYGMLRLGQQAERWWRGEIRTSQLIASVLTPSQILWLGKTIGQRTAYPLHGFENGPAFLMSWKNDPYFKDDLAWALVGESISPAMRFNELRTGRSVMMILGELLGIQWNRDLPEGLALRQMADQKLAKEIEIERRVMEGHPEVAQRLIDAWNKQVQDLSSRYVTKLSQIMSRHAGTQLPVASTKVIQQHLLIKMPKTYQLEREQRYLTSEPVLYGEPTPRRPRVPTMRP